MRRKGQIFLIITILVITFMIGITAILFDVRRSDYFDPAPDSDVTLQAWETTIQALKQMIDVQPSINSIAGDPNATVVDFSSPISNIELYLNERGFSAVIEPLTIPILFTISGDNTISTNVGILATFDIFLASSSTEINQQIEIAVTYFADYSIANSEVYIKKQINQNNVEYIIESISSNSNVNDNFDGSYDTTGVSTPSFVTFTTPNGIQLNVLIN